MRRLYTRIYWHFILVLVMVAGATFLLSTLGFRSALLHEYSERLAAHTAQLLAPTWSDPQQSARLARQLADELGLDLTLRQPDGRLRIAIGAELPAPEGDQLDAALQGGHFVKQPLHGWYVAAPVRELGTGRVLGLLETTRARHFQSAGLFRPAVTVALALLVIALGTAPLARRISRPVERLTEASRRLGAGELGYRIRPPRRWRHRRDELSELTRAWNEMAERVERLVRGHRELLANVSHELRSPLQRIRLALELVPERIAPEVTARLGDVKVDLGELERLIDDVLTTSRLEATGLPTHLGQVAVASLLAQLVERAARDPVTEGKPVRLGPVAEATFDADGALLKRALWNLVENAAKYGAPPITLAAEERGGRLLLSVADEGPGIAAADRERVLDAFYRADRARTPSTGFGFGLGLTLARRIAEVHGGTIRVEPARDQEPVGCRVTIEVPISDPSG